MVRQNLSGTKNGNFLGREGVNTILASTQHEDFGGQEPLCVQGTFILRVGGKSLRTRRRLDRNGGGGLRVAPAKGLDPKPRNESCRQVSPSQVRDAFGPHDDNEHTRRAIASGGVHSAIASRWFRRKASQRLTRSGSFGARFIQRETVLSESSKPSMRSSPWIRGAPAVQSVKKCSQFGRRRNCGIVSSSLKADVNAFERLHIVLGANSSCWGSK